MLTFRERHALAEQFAGDVMRMSQCRQTAGIQVTDDDVVRSGTRYSPGLCACWSTLSEKDALVLTTLLEYLPSWPSTWHATLRNAGDGSDNKTFVLPDELLDRLGWREGDMLTIAIFGPDELIVRRADKSTFGR